VIRRVFPEVGDAVADAATARDVWGAAVALLESRRLPPSDALGRLLSEIGIPGAGSSAPQTVRDAVTLANLARTLVRALDRYEPSGAIASTIHYFQAAESAGRFDANWERFTNGGVEVHTTPGDHFSLLRRPHASRLADALVRLASEALARNERLAAARR
jgi:hypothetical protein